ncbi:hypothetical protein OSTOST_09328 [Ostertagia ostertagi]
MFADTNMKKFDEIAKHNAISSDCKTPSGHCRSRRSRFDHYTCTEAVTCSEIKSADNVSHLGPPKERILETDSLVLEVDNLRLQFLYCRSQLRTLHAIPLLNVMDKMSRDNWESLMNRSQEWRKFDENVTSDHLETLSTLRSNLNNFRMEAENVKEEDVVNSEKEFRNKLAHLEQLILDSRNSIMEALEIRVTSPNQRHHELITEHHQNGAEEIAQIRGENSIIEENINFTEGVKKSETMKKNPMNGEVDGQAVLMIEQEIRSAEQAIHNFEEILRHLDNVRLCPFRRFGHGNINKYHERFMSCGFCKAMGSSCSIAPISTLLIYDEERIESTRRNHLRYAAKARYSMKLFFWREPQYLIRYFVHCPGTSRNQKEVESTDRCRQCFKFLCSRGSACKKYMTLCFYCRERDHHSALCNFPDYSDEARSRQDNAYEGRRRNIAKLEKLRRELRLYGIRP